MTAGLESSAPHIHDAQSFEDLVDWGEQPDCTAGPSRSSGRLLYKRPDPAAGGNSPETGLWVVTPGSWPLTVPRDEFCHFIAGRATYVRDDGETIEVRPGTCVHFTAGWTGRCTVHETLRNVYMLR
jgi:uncharacterized cupin superfamily protein